MKTKQILSVLMGLLVVICCAIPTYAKQIQMELQVDGTTIMYDKPQIHLVLDGTPYVALQMEPIELDGVTYVSAREVFEYFGAIVTWKGSTQEVFIAIDSQLVSLQLGRPFIMSNGIQQSILSPPKLINGNTMIPLRVASEAFGFEVGWEPISLTASITSNTPMYTENTPNQNNNTEIPTTWLNNSSIDMLPIENHGKVDVSQIIESNNTFIIQTSGPITKAEQSIFPGNRLVIDIFNATALTNEKYRFSAISVKEIRTSQFQQEPTPITRVVFEYEEGTSFDVQVAPDRSSIIVTLKQQPIDSIFFQTEGIKDIVRITGQITAPEVNVTYDRNQYKLVIDVPLAVLKDSQHYEFLGRLVSFTSVAQEQPDLVRITLLLADPIKYTVSKQGMTTTIAIEEPTYKHIYYDYEQTMIVIPKHSGSSITLNNTIKEDLYEEKIFRLTLSNDISHYIGFGEYYVDDYMLNSFEISSDGRQTILTIHEKSVIDFVLDEDYHNYYFKARRPKDVLPFVVVVDPGHGGNDPGSSGGGYLEKDLNLAISKQLVLLLENNPNITVYSTRLDDRTIPLEERPVFANQIGDLFISIHGNAFTNPETNGIETYYCPHENDNNVGITTKEVAEIIHKHVINEFDLFDRGVKKAEFVVLKRTDMPAALVELGFLSNANDLAVITSPDFPQRAAMAIYNAILEIMTIYYP